MPDSAVMKTYERPTQYVVSAVPEDLCMDYYAWNIEVDWRGPGDLWAVKRFSQCLGSDGLWDYESIPSERTDEWKRTHRFPLAEALRLAHEAAPSVVVNGITPADLLAKYGAVGRREH